MVEMKSLHRFIVTIDPVADVPADHFDAKIKMWNSGTHPPAIGCNR
ncbi:hypothetical protein [Streptomyces sp. NBC_00059]|nr:hypothetical protein [Streptomyces sp. NBC_00059]MCX5416077.1 hypothetical protein [Streptomyces sp. NBC_00059]